MLLSRAKPSGAPPSESGTKSGSAKGSKRIPDLEEFLSDRDYSGAIALLEFNKSTGKGTESSNNLWLAYCHFHSGNIDATIKIYKDMVKNEAIPRRKNSGKPTLNDRKKSIVEGAVNLLKGASRAAAKDQDSAMTTTLDDVWLYISCCHFFLGEYDQATEALRNVGSLNSSLKVRLDLHLAHKKNADGQLMEQNQGLVDALEDQLCLASVHYLRTHYQDAIDIYKKILVDNRTFIALNVFVALCYYKLDYYDVSQEVLAMYLAKYPDSVTAVNIKACNHYRLYNGKAAEAELRTFLDSASSSFGFAKDIIRHNLVVFKGGEGAMQVFPSLLSVLPEARLNLTIYHLKNNNLAEASDLMASVEPSAANEYILKGIVNALQGQKMGDRDALKSAQQYFQLVGGSASECDTIPGRQCMASCFFLLKQFEDVLLYLSSIKSYFYNDDHFNFNYAQAKVATGNYKEGLELLTNISSPAVRSEPVFAACLIRSYIMTKRMDEAWNVYAMATKEGQTSGQSFNLLTMMANDCYKMGLFLDSLKAFSALEKLDTGSSPAEYWEGKRGAACGHFQSVVAGKDTIDSLKEVIKLTTSSVGAKSAQTTQADQIVAVIKKWVADHQNQSTKELDEVKI